MVTFRKSSSVPVTAAELFAWHARFGGFDRLGPPWANVRLYSATAGVENGARWIIRTPGGLPWVADLLGVIPGREFQDRQRFGPFAAWHHTHRFEPAGESAVLADHVEFALRLGLAGELAAAEIERLFAFRHTRTVRDLTRHAAFRHDRRTFAVTGSRGLIGRELVPFLTAAGHRVVRLVTGRPDPGPLDDTRWVRWNPKVPVSPGVLAGADAVIHLASEPIAEGRWTKSKRAAIRESRTVPTRLLAEAAAKAGVPAFVSASGVGVYGDRGDTELTETEPAGSGFLADVCRDWEAAANTFPGRAVTLRIGTVLTPRGAALGRQLLPFRIGLGAVLGTGTQFVPWVGIDDTVAAIHFAAMTETLSGPVNVTAPSPVRQREFADTLARVLHRPRFLTLPGGMVEGLVGNVAVPALLSSMKAVPAKLLSAGFRFDGPGLEQELRFLLGR